VYSKRLPASSQQIAINDFSIYHSTHT
jgi:hypothetical protein